MRLGLVGLLASLVLAGCIGAPDNKPLKKTDAPIIEPTPPDAAPAPAGPVALERFNGTLDGFGSAAGSVDLPTGEGEAASFRERGNRTAMRFEVRGHAAFHVEVVDWGAETSSGQPKVLAKKDGQGLLVLDVEPDAFAAAKEPGFRVFLSDGAAVDERFEAAASFWARAPPNGYSAFAPREAAAVAA